MPQRGLPAINFFFFHDKQTTTGKYCSVAFVLMVKLKLHNNYYNHIYLLHHPEFMEVNLS